MAGGNRIELWGRLVNAPQLRITPGGRPVLKMIVECASEGEKLRLEVVMSGDEAREFAALASGREVHVAGSLRNVARRTRSGIDDARVEVVAREIRLATGEP
jgi:primosomal replication protein N